MELIFNSVINYQAYKAEHVEASSKLFSHINKVWIRFRHSCLKLQDDLEDIGHVHWTFFLYFCLAERKKYKQKKLMYGLFVGHGCVEDIKWSLFKVEAVKLLHNPIQFPEKLDCLNKT